jgi:hypothetical protein
MSQGAIPDDVPAVFNFRAWNARGESWDDYIRAVERAYAQYLEHRRQGVEWQPAAPPPGAEAGMQEG